MKLTWYSVRGVDMTMPMIVTMTEKTAVHRVWPESVFSTLAPVRTWKPMRRMLFAINMKAEKA